MEKWSTIHPVFAFFQARDSQLNRRIFASGGEFSGAESSGLQIVSVFFLLIEIAALIIGVVLTQRDYADGFRALSRHAICAGRKFFAPGEVERKDSSACWASRSTA